MRRTSLLVRWVLPRLGVIVSLAGCAFVTHAIGTQWDSVRDVVSEAEPTWLILGWILAAVGMATIALPWRSAQRLVGPSFSRFDTLTLYFQGELGKYVPGSIWAVAGRAELARGRGISAVGAYAGVALSLVGLYLACALVAVAALVMDLGSSPGPAAWLLMVLPVGMVLLHPRVLGPALLRVPAFRNLSLAPPSWSQSARLILQYVPGWLLVAGATMCMARALTPRLDEQQILLATTLSWLAGFLTPGVPGGIGVREAVFVSVVSGLSSDGAVAVLARLAFVTVDAGGAGLAYILRRAGARPHGV